jgi:hypothetical protein
MGITSFCTKKPPESPALSLYEGQKIRGRKKEAPKRIKTERAKSKTLHSKKKT